MVTLRRLTSPPPIPVDSLHHDKDLLPGTVSAWLASDNGLSENRFQAMHICREGRGGKWGRRGRNGGVRELVMGEVECRRWST